MATLNDKMTAIANNIRTKRILPSSTKLNLDAMATQINGLEHAFWKQVSSGNTTYSSMTIDLSTIAPYAFYGLKGINTMTFTNENLTEIGESAFKNCSVKNLTLPTGITSLSKEMFANSSITSFEATGVKSVGEGCFKNCSLTSTPKLSNEIKIIPAYFCYTNGYGAMTSFAIPT
jgi:hypothetical protein